MRTRHGARAIAAALLACAPETAAAADAKAFHLQIGQTGIELDPGEKAQVALPDGRTATVVLTRNDQVTYRGATFSFVHPGNLSVAKTGLGGRNAQHLMATASGTVLIVQEYFTKIDPALLTQLALRGLVKDAVQTGAQVNQHPAKRTAGGKAMSGLAAVAKAGGGTTRYEVEAYADGDYGIVVITLQDEATPAGENAVLTKFWDTFAITK